MLTVLVVGRNCSATLPAALRSFRECGDVSARLVYVDHESRDGSIDLAREHGAEVFECAAPTLAAAKAYAISIVRAGVACFLDADDEFEPGCATAAALCDPSGAPCFTSMRYGDRLLPPATSKESIYCGRYPQHACFFGVEAALAVGGMDPMLPAAVDWDLHVRLVHRFGYVTAPECVYRYSGSHHGSQRDRLRARIIITGRARALVDGDM